AISTPSTGERAITTKFSFTLNGDLFGDVSGDDAVKDISSFLTLRGEILKIIDALKADIANVGGSLEEILSDYVKKYQDQTQVISDELQQAINDYQKWSQIFGSSKELWDKLNQTVSQGQLHQLLLNQTGGTPMYSHSLAELKTTYPNGHEGLYWLADTGNLSYWDRVSNAWVDSGQTYPGISPDQLYQEIISANMYDRVAIINSSKTQKIDITMGPDVLTMTVPDPMQLICGSKFYWIKGSDGDQTTFDLSAIGGQGGVLIFN
ncbi:hypothetical protein, partial [Lactiplantibacillus mudanjiangensis]|uniref:hypothetical protein n=1 Tax=Lactiplantibacillus mudanjiangensis TaxID=1296538 RepID=UPI0013EF2E14